MKTGDVLGIMDLLVSLEQNDQAIDKIQNVLLIALGIIVFVISPP